MVAGELASPPPPVSAPITSTSYQDILDRVSSLLPAADGFECYPFRIGSYNDVVGPEFQLAHPQDAMGVLVVSTPAMFDVSFKRWVRDESSKAASFDDFAQETTSPISEFIDSRIERVSQSLRNTDFEVLHDHSMTANRRPRILMCTCGHVAGAAYYYRQADLAHRPPSTDVSGDSSSSGGDSGEDEWNPAPAATNLKFIGLSLHARYGGHFAFRCAILFPGVTLPATFTEKKPIATLRTIDEKRDALEKFNYAWRDSQFRDCGNPSERYSDTQMAYFGRAPADRWEVIRHWNEEKDE